MTWRVPFVDFPKQYRSMEQDIDAALKRVMVGGDFILRADVTEFEKNIAKYVGTNYAVGVNSCTDAMLLSLLACVIGQGDEVITVAHTFVATVEVIVHCGATPVLVDVGTDYNINPALIERAITSHTKAILPVHLNGRCCDMDALQAIAEKHGLLIIEDAAQSLGATYNGKKAGSFGIAGCFSFYPAKVLGCAGDGGVVTTNWDVLANKVRLLRDHGRATKDTVAGYGYNSRLDNLQAAILNVKMRHLDNWIKYRRTLADVYQRGLYDVPEVQLPPAPNGFGIHFDSFQNYVIRAQRRDDLAKYLIGASIETIISWPIAMHKQDSLPLKGLFLPMTEQLAKEVVSLPLIPEISVEQVEYVVETIRQFYGRV